MRSHTCAHAHARAHTHAARTVLACDVNSHHSPKGKERARSVRRLGFISGQRTSSLLSVASQEAGVLLPVLHQPCLVPGPGGLGPGWTPVKAPPLVCPCPVPAPGLPRPLGRGGESPTPASQPPGRLTPAGAADRGAGGFRLGTFPRQPRGHGGRCACVRNRCSLLSPRTPPPPQTDRREALLLGNQREGRSGFCMGNRSRTGSVAIL